MDMASAAPSSGMKWRAMRLLFGTLGRTSRGIDIGYRHGFDSGTMLDYVYEDRARGRFLIGLVLDRLYLNAVGWRAIRERRALLTRVVLREVEARRVAGKETAVLDVASGPGRYLLDVCGRLRASEKGLRGVSVVCRDLDPGGLQRGRELAQAMGLSEVRYEQGDACDPASLATVDPRPDIVIVSGLYELFTDSAPIRRSLRGIREIVKPGGRLIFTTQVSHPQLEFIANVLVNREGKPWVMVCRSVGEAEALARGAGFRVVGTQLEPLGLFAVIMAEA